jgi:adenylate kinase
MTTRQAHDLAQAKDPDLRTSLQALQRAAELARKTAVQTGTDIVIVENQQIVRLTARQLLVQGMAA